MEGSEGKRSRRGRRQARLLLVVLAVVGLPAAGAFAAFPQDPPNDPDYAPAEASLAACLTNSVNDDQYGLFSFMPRCAPAATDPENSSGDFTDQAWKQYSAGRGDVVIAYVEGGINWHLDDAKDLANKV